ncbi:hypothetical protein D0Y65_052777 [Glycine soja]|uniref:Nodulin-16 n=1 Tax=Glycine soja TaxID=3848 RepID=A0A0B2NUQ8_GLYSO|nr:hypothetical protein glysoja_024287 [Glycine soja]RZB41914.1 hypothetical protein D0Y65_052777 [Glycine soja]
MGSKALLVLVMFLASALILSAEVAPKNLDENFDAKHVGVVDTNGVDEKKDGYVSWRSGVPLRCAHPCCYWYHGRCLKYCCGPPPPKPHN